MDAEIEAVSERYGRFAREEAVGRSTLYAEWATDVEADAEIAGILARIPAIRRQPPLVFAVTRLLGAPESNEWGEWVRRHADELVAEAGRRSLQTNEPLRCAALLPALSTVAGPIALLEVGASAGLCLYPDRYSYRYPGFADLDPADGVSSVVLGAELVGTPDLRMPEVMWRAGIDLEPLDARDAADRRFLTTLVWPGETGRAARVEAALDIVASDPPVMIRGDAADPDMLRDAAASAPPEATLVVTTPGVLPHVPRAGRDRIIETVRALDAVWITIDPPGLHDAWDPPVDPATWGGFVLGRDGIPLAAVDPLGARVEWRTGSGAAGS